MRKRFYMSPPKVKYYFNVEVKDVENYKDSFTTYDSISVVVFFGEKEKALHKAEKAAIVLLKYTIVKVELSRYEII